MTVLLNTGNVSSIIRPRWSDLDLQPGTRVNVTDLWTGQPLGVLAPDTLAASVAPHDAAALRLQPLGP